jgi:hypothetical protein
MVRSACVLLLVGSLCGAQNGVQEKTQVSQKQTYPSPQKSTITAEDEIKKIEQRWLDALVKRDQGTVADILAPEFQDTMIDGKVHNRDQALAAVLDTTRPALSRFFGRMDVKVYDGKFAVVHGLTVLNGDKIREAHVVFTDVFVKRDAKWQAVAAQEALESS